MNFLKTIDIPSDLRKISEEHLPEVASEIRSFMNELPSVKKGHLQASLGVVELTIALHYVFNTPFDSIVFDVGHQTYPHKILTGRKKQMNSLRQWKGISGFPNPSESIYDTFVTGHSSTSISAVLGKAVVASVQQKKNKYIAVIGDASLGAGIAFEALNMIKETWANVLIIVNDNQMGIDPTVGGLKSYLKRISSENDTFFTSLHIDFLGSIDGHNFQELLPILQKAKQYFGIQLLHIKTQKGKGLEIHKKEKSEIFSNESVSFSDVFGQTLIKLASRNEKIMVISPAMISGSSLISFQQKFPSKIIDVGIAEQHALTFSAGVASEGFIPFCVVYSSFLQRAYDQLIHDIALQNLPVVLCIDRAGLVGEDGATHQGVFDVAFLQCIPNLLILSPGNGMSFQNMLYTAQTGVWKCPVVIRYPKGKTQKCFSSFEVFDFTQVRKLQKGTNYAVLSVGFSEENVQKALEISEVKSEFSHYVIECIKPLNENFLHQIFTEYSTIIVVEENSEIGGFYSTLSMFANKNKYKNTLFSVAIPDEFILHGSIVKQQKYCKIGVYELSETFKKIVKN